ncbi:MAG: tetratricopeptide repeat-containing sulfotransferase family protein [Pseudomonadota bacterium]
MQANSQTQQQLLQQVHQLIGSKRFEQAWNRCNLAIEQFPKFANVWMAKSFIAFSIGRYSDARAAIDTAIQLEPDNLNFKLQKVMLLEQSGDFSAAIEEGEKLLDLELKDKQILGHLTTFFQKYHNYENVEVCYQKALKLEPGNQDLLLKKATAASFLGKIDEAERLASQALKQNEFDCEVQFFRSHLKSQTANSNHISELKELTEKTPQQPLKKVKAFYALAKELEDCEKYSESFKVREKAAKIYRSGLNYNFQEDLAFIRALRKHYNAELIKQKLNQQTEQNRSNEAIFVAGLPRTGTTLLERVVTSHSDVYSAGELPHFSRLMSAGMAGLKLNPNLPRSKMVSSSSNLDFCKLGQQYLEVSRPKLMERPHFVDKLPQNALYVGLLHLALPNSKILLLERHPLDVCYSVYKQLFTDAFQFSYDLEELAEYYYEHQLLMSHWQQVLPNAVKTVKYEDLVDDFETTARSVIEFCDLDWQESCLEFHKNKQPSTTASASQVRQKVYSTSVGKWKHYRAELQPLISKLESLGCLEGWEY